MDWKSMLDKYHEDHRHPVNRACHAVGMPTIACSVLALPFSPLWALGLFVLGWAFQFVGHWVEGKPPLLLSNPRYAVIGAVYWWKRIRNKA
jgi:uncharacterized membrane protein YGL010W